MAFENYISCMLHRHKLQDFWPFQEILAPFLKMSTWKMFPQSFGSYCVVLGFALKLYKGNLFLKGAVLLVTALRARVNREHWYLRE